MRAKAAIFASLASYRITAANLTRLKNGDRLRAEMTDRRGHAF